MKIRADELLLRKNLVKSKGEALAYIMEGSVYVDEVRVWTVGEKIEEDANIWIKGQESKYVSRGGDKLEKAIDLYDLELRDKVIMDIGSSTGGFTDCMLQNGARKVYALDVGYGQLDWKLRNDSRVVVMERTNIRDVSPEMLGEKLDFASIDVSFISLSLVLPVLKEILKKDGRAVALIKPQFEAKREDVGENGVIVDKDVHVKTLNYVMDFIDEIGFKVEGLTYSPITGAKGNIEFLALLALNGDTVSQNKILEVVEKAHENLRK